MSPLDRVRRVTARAVIASQERDMAIREAHESGETVRAIAAAAGLSHSRVHQILHGR